MREVRNRGLEPTAVVEVKEVLKSSLVNIPKETQTLYYSSSCLCPPLSPGEEYLIMGYENDEMSRYEGRVRTVNGNIFKRQCKASQTGLLMLIANVSTLKRNGVENPLCDLCLQVAPD